MKPDLVLRKRVLRQILPDLLAAGDLESDVTRVPGFPFGGDGKAVQVFEDAWMANQPRFLKAMDENGNVYKIENPLYRGTGKNESGFYRSQSQKPERLMSWSEAVAEADRTPASRIQIGHSAGGDLF